MEGDRRCPKCGQLIPLGEADCPHCRVEDSAQNHPPETVLFLLPGWPGHPIYSHRFHGSRFPRQATTVGTGILRAREANLKAGQPEQAIIDFRTALIYSHDNDDYQLHLAQALLAANHAEEARVYLSELWERHPEGAVVNLELGRLSARARDIDQALRYYHNAIYGEWEGAIVSQQRREARLELYQFLLSRGAKSQAEAELEALAAELPADANLHTQVGNLFLKSGQFNRALSEYTAALNVDKNHLEALAGAGEAEFHLNNFRYALPYLWRAMKHDPQTPG